MRRTAIPRRSMMTTFASAALTAQNVAAMALCAYVMRLRYETLRASSSEDATRRLLGDTSARSVTLSSFPGFAFALTFFIVRTKTSVARVDVDGTQTESVVPLVIAASVCTAVKQYAMLKHPHEMFELGFPVGCLLGSVVASKIL